MKRRTLTLALIVCMVAIIGMGSLAYFQSHKTVTNYFAVAGVDDPTDPSATIDPDTLFSIKLEETDVSKTDGSKTESGNTYTGILPGDVLTKDPTVTNTGKYDAWVRVNVVVSDAAAWTAACQKHEITNLENIFSGYVDADWTRYDAPAADTAADTLTYTFYLNKELAPEASAVLFEKMTIPSAFDSDDLSSLATFNLEITAEAIQVRNTADNAKDAFALWTAENP